MAKRELRVTSKDVPELLKTLSCGDAVDQTIALQKLCPCRNRRYDREVWLAIFRAYEAEKSIAVRDQAFHAIDTLIKRGKNDPRTQELLCWLSEQGITALPLAEAVPEWKPGGRGGLNGLYIPRYEASPRSRANRRR